MAVTDLEKESLHILSINSSSIQKTVSHLGVAPTGVVMMDGNLYVSDTRAHFVHMYDVKSENFTVAVGLPGSSGVKDGPVCTASLTSPVGLACFSL